jgi:hypothetical protein
MGFGVTIRALFTRPEFAQAERGIKRQSSGVELHCWFGADFSAGLRSRMEPSPRSGEQIAFDTRQRRAMTLIGHGSNAGFS